MHKIEPSDEHRWLQKLVGEWEWESPYTEEGKPPQVMRGKEVVRSLGDLWVMAEGESDTPGGGISRSVMTLGFDPQKGRFVGTFVASMMANLWIYEGVLEGDVLILDTIGPAFTPEGGLVPYKDMIELRGDGAERSLRSVVQGADGTWSEFMKATYRRR